MAKQRTQNHSMQRAHRVLYIQYTNPAVFPPLEHGSRILAGRGWHVRFLGIYDHHVNALAFPPHERIEVRRMRACKPGWRQKIHYLAFVVWCFATALAWRPRWVYVSDAFAAPAGLLVSIIPGIRIVYHEHDWPAWPAAEYASVFVRMLMRARRALARTATLRVIPNQARAERFQAEIAPGRGVHVVWNCPRRDEVLPRQAQWDHRIRLLYQGSVNSSLVPPAVIRALTRVPEVEFIVVGYETIGSLGYLDELRRTAVECGVGDRVFLLGPLPRWRLASIRATCHVGLAVIPRMSDNPNMGAMFGASNKVFDYMAAGMLPLVSNSPEWRSALVDRGLAVDCDPDDPASIEQVLRWCRDNPDVAAGIGERGRQMITEQWNYETQFEPVLRAVTG